VRWLLDVNILIGLAFPTHVLSKPAHSWYRLEPDRLWATCALTQAGFLRIVSRTLGGRQAVRETLAGLERDCSSPLHEYWPVDIDLRELSDWQRSRLIGHNQVTEMQLLMLAHRHRGQLATFDGGIADLARATGYSNSVLVLQS